MDKEKLMEHIRFTGGHFEDGKFYIQKDKVINLIDQLDEPKPEVLIAERTVEKEPEKPVVPSFVAEWYEKNIEGGYITGDNKFSGNDVFRVVQDVIKVQNDETTWEDFAVDEKITKFAAENEEVFLHLLVNCSYKSGYTVEEKKYYVRDMEGGYLQSYEVGFKNCGGTTFWTDYEERTIRFSDKDQAQLIKNITGGKVEEVTE